jgi:hypothetical protein
VFSKENHSEKDLCGASWGEHLGGFLERGNAIFLMNKTLTLSRNGGILLLQFHQMQKMLRGNEFL